MTRAPSILALGKGLQQIVTTGSILRHANVLEGGILNPADASNGIWNLVFAATQRSRRPASQQHGTCMDGCRTAWLRLLRNRAKVVQKASGIEAAAKRERRNRSRTDVRTGCSATPSSSNQEATAPQDTCPSRPRAHPAQPSSRARQTAARAAGLLRAFAGHLETR